MRKDLELWQFISERLERGENVMLLVVAESSGSSPGRQGYKMAVALDGELMGSIGGGVMEVNLVEQSRALLSAPPSSAGGLRKQVHRKDDPNSSGMICSGKQTVVFRVLSPEDSQTVRSILASLIERQPAALKIGAHQITVGPPVDETQNAKPCAIEFQTGPADLTPNNPKSNIPNPKSIDFTYTEALGVQNDLYIIGGGHCALALSELISKMDFRISIFDDRPDLNTIQNNSFAHVIKIVDSYERIGDHIPSGGNAYAVVMTLGYLSDQIVVRSLIEKEFKYFGVLGSKAKMSAMFKSLRQEGISDKLLARIRTPIGLPINSRTPEEIAVSIAAEIISVKNG